MLTYKVAWTWGHKLREALRPHIVPKDPRPSERFVTLHATRTREQSPVNAPCACAKLLERDWSWPDEMAEEREATRRRERFLRGERLPVETVPEDCPPCGDWNVGWDLLAQFQGSLSEKHLGRYLDAHAFFMNRKETPIPQRFETAVRALVSAEPVSYRAIAARAAPEGYPLSFIVVTVRRPLRVRSRN